MVVGIPPSISQHPLYLIFGLLFLQKSTKPNRAAQLLNLLTFGLWGKLGRLTHYAFDAVLCKIHPLCVWWDDRRADFFSPIVSAFLAGMKRSTGLTPSLKKDSITENKDINVWIEKYLGVGEWVMDQSVAIAGSSGWFERKR
ncbi:DUF1748 domain containing protein [Rutstroemia sp. NJR-2017a BBW]|nr:DUF1748 domain containing protein [Rutstroemia sp. NJR-2017a BBW]